MGMFLRCTVGSQAVRCDHLHIISSSHLLSRKQLSAFPGICYLLFWVDLGASWPNR